MGKGISWSKIYDDTIWDLKYQKNVLDRLNNRWKITSIEKIFWLMWLVSSQVTSIVWINIDFVTQEQKWILNFAKKVKWNQESLFWWINIWWKVNWNQVNSFWINIWNNVLWEQISSIWVNIWNEVRQQEQGFWFQYSKINDFQKQYLWIQNARDSVIWQFQRFWLQFASWKIWSQVQIIWWYQKSNIPTEQEQSIIWVQTNWLITEFNLFFNTIKSKFLSKI